MKLSEHGERLIGTPYLDDTHPFSGTAILRQPRAPAPPMRRRSPLAESTKRSAREQAATPYQVQIQSRGEETQLYYCAMMPEASVPDLLVRLQAVLADRHTIGRELRQGAMGMVLPAQDHKHNRQAVIKVLKPDLAAALGRQRFLREIATAAGTNH